MATKEVILRAYAINTERTNSTMTIYEAYPEVAEDQLYQLINDEIADDDSTKIIVINDNATCMVPFSFKFPKIKTIKGFETTTRLKGEGTNWTGQPNIYIFPLGNGQDESFHPDAIKYTNSSSTAWETHISDLSENTELLDYINNWVDSASDNAIISVDLCVGQKKTGNNKSPASCEYTQFYIKLTYEDPTPTIYDTNSSSNITAAGPVYKKENGAWVPYNASILTDGGSYSCTYVTQ